LVVTAGVCGGAEPGSVEERLRDLEYPELRQRDPREVEIFKEFVAAREETFKLVDAFYRSRHASAMDHAKAAYGRRAARAELAYAEHRIHNAVEELVLASKSAARWAEATNAAYETGTVTLEMMLEAQGRRAEAKLALVRAEKVARAAGVDISDIDMPRRE
jgi:hypothetical protein